MQALKLASAIVTMTLVAGLTTGCSDPFKRTSNPVEDYKGVLDESQKYDPYKAPVKVVNPDNTQKVCMGAFDVSIVGDRAASLMVFTEDVSASYKIVVRSYLGDDFQITAADTDMPKGASLKQVDNAKNITDKNIKTYEFAWQPKKSNSETARFEILALRYSSSYYKANCGTTDVRERLTLAVLTTAEGVLVNAILPPTKITWGESFDFTIEVNDPASNATSAPTIAVGFNSSITNAELAPEKQILNASKSVTCAKQARLKEGTTWIFDCKFDTAKVEKSSTFKDSGLSIESAFHIVATSGRKGRDGAEKSEATPAYVQLDFPKTEAPPTETQPAKDAPDLKVEGA